MLFNIVSHLIFVMKYWVVSKKVESVLKSTNGDRIDCRAKVYITLSLVLILGTVGISAYYGYNINPMAQRRYEQGVGFLIGLGPIVEFIFLADALLRMIKYRNQF